MNWIISLILLYAFFAIYYTYKDVMSSFFVKQIFTEYKNDDSTIKVLKFAVLIASLLGAFFVHRMVKNGIKKIIRIKRNKKTT